MNDELGNTDADLMNRYGYTRREGQSTHYLVVPAALLEEVRASIPPGDAQETIDRILLVAERAEELRQDRDALRAAVGGLADLIEERLSRLR